MAEMFDLGFDLTLDDLQGCEVEEIDSLEGDSQSSPDLFDNKFAISFYALIPNTILREDTDVLSMLIQISLDIPESRNKIKSLVKDLDIFITHMERKITATDIPANVNTIVMNDIYDTFYKKVLSIKETAKDILQESAHYQSEQIADFFAGDANILSDNGKVLGLVTYIITTNKFDSAPNTSLAVALAEKYDAYINSTNRTNEIIDSYKRLKELTKENIKQRRTDTIATLIKLTQYSKKSYFFTAEELAAMEYLGFPYQVAGYEQYLKSSPIKVLEEKAGKLNKSKSKLQESLKQIDQHRSYNIENNRMLFARKRYLCKENDMVGVNANCIYF